MRLPDERDFSTRLRDPAITSRVGLWLGISFATCFLTGLVSHWAQSPDPWLAFPTRPVWGYRLTQGLHVVSGTMAVPLLLVKLWTVYPKLFARPPRRVRELALHGAERVSIAVLISAAIFQLATGLANSAQWYPWAFRFVPTHYAVAWIAIGALAIHVAVKLPIVRASLGRAGRAATVAETTTLEDGLSRRGLLRTTWLAAGVAALATAGSTVPLLRHVSVFGVRSGDGPGGIPINKSAKAADVVAAATNPAYRLSIGYGDRELTLSRDDLAAMRQTTEDLPIACVEGWSASGAWTGVRVRELLDLVDAPRGSDVTVTSLQPKGPYRVISLPADFADDPLTLLALGLEGEPLSIDHGYPCRLIAPNRPGVLQTKWVARLEAT
ncbi:molybdopterin-dependent oxidoreductase [Nocardioides speluncae]|uniref:molybdopterin-dependent oxidoreductase n=1 Tax=Nocardioides speluncae TaxID=2670337 RepID=UPI000D69A627|nr:molybdopterin-dependent oxidoreductase [Nocardioides speluncae]